MMQFIRQFVREEEGQDVVEYALVIGLVALGGGVGLVAFSGQIGEMLNNVGVAMNGFTPAALP